MKKHFSRNCASHIQKSETYKLARNLNLRGGGGGGGEKTDTDAF